MKDASRSLFAAPATNFVKNVREFSRWLFLGKFFPAFVIILLAVLSSAVVGYLKADALRSWSYTSDMFSFDTVMQETLRGNIGLEFTYCNTFGDHAYLFLFLLTPLKLLLSSKMIYLLVLLGPLCYLVSSIIFFFSAKQIAHPWKAFLASLIFMFGFGQTYRGLFEYVYGMHPDTFAGYLLVAVAAFLIWKETNEAHGENAKPQTAGAVIFLLAFLLLKEEMAMIGILFFIIVLFFKRTTFHRNMAFLSGLILVIGLIVMALAKTPANRTNNVLLDSFIKNLQTYGLNFFFNNPQVSREDMLSFWLAIVLSCVLFSVAAVLSKRMNPYGLGLLLAGLVKIGLGVVLDDFSLVTWHNFPGLVMISAACLIQFLYVEKDKSFYSLLALILLAVVSVYSFLSDGILFTREKLAYNAERKVEVSVYHTELSQLIKQVDPTSVVSVPQLAVKRWVGYRYAFYPRGVTYSPVGIADFVVFPLGKAQAMTFWHPDKTPPPALLKSFSVVDQTPHFILFKRNSLPESDAASREACLSGMR